MTNNPDDLITKAELCRQVGKSEEFVSKLPLPCYPVGKRNYFKLSDYQPTIDGIKKEPKQWVSTKSKGRRTGNSTLPSRGKDIEAQRKQLRKAKHLPSTQSAEARHF